MMRNLRRFLKDEGQSGSVLVEFAFVVPLLIMLAIPVVDYGRLILLRQKAVKMASFAADAVTMSREIEATTTQADVNADATFMTPQALAAIVGSVNTMMMPFPAEQQNGADIYRVVLTHVYRDPASGQPVLGWQFDQNSRSFYNPNRISDVGLVASPADIGTPATIPASLANNMDDGENLVVAEVAAFFNPIAPDLSALGIPLPGPQWLTYTAYFRARYGNLKCVWGVYMPPTPACAPVPGANTGPF